MDIKWLNGKILADAARSGIESLTVAMIITKIKSEISIYLGKVFYHYTTEITLPAPK